MTISSINTKISNDLAHHYTDRRELRNAQLLYKILAASTIMNVGIIVALLLFSKNGITDALIASVSVIGNLTSFYLLRHGYRKIASMVFLLQGWSSAATIPFFIGESSTVVFPVFLILLFIAVILLSKVQITFFTILCFATMLVTFLLTKAGNMPPPLYTMDFTTGYINQLGLSAVSFALFWYLRNSMVEITAQAEKNESIAIKSNLNLKSEIEIRKQAEAELEHERANLAEKVEFQTAEIRHTNAMLEDASKRKDAFLATMSHELRTPLNVVITGSQAMQLGIYGKLNEKQAEKITGIQSSGQHLLSLINDILDVSKIAAGEEKINLTPVNLIEVCNEAASLVANLAKKGNLTLSLDLDDAVTQILGDKRRLKQIMTNLLSNSIKFTPEGGEVGVTLVGHEKEKELSLTIWDTGIGIPEENIESLFEPFIQVDSSLSRKHNGTGIGLSLVKQLSQMHGGTVRAESQVGKGSQFIVTLPWEPEFIEQNETATKIVDSTISF